MDLEPRYPWFESRESHEFFLVIFFSSPEPKAPGELIV